MAGGVWKTTNFLQVGGQPNWAPLTDQASSLAIGALAMSPLDPSYNTLFAGTGNFISGGDNGRAVGILRTTDGGTTWQLLAQATLDGRNIRSVVPTTLGGDLQHQVVLVAAWDSSPPKNSGGVYRSTDGGSTFTPLSGINGLGDGLDNDTDGSTDEADEANASHLVGDPGNSTRFFAAVPGQGIFRSSDGGQQWTKVSNPIPNMASTTRIELSVSAATGNTVYAALLGPTIADPNGTYLRSVYYSTDHGTNWTALGTVPGVNQGGSGDIHFSILADPTHPNLVYIGGDRRPYPGPYFGHLYRGDTTTGSWTAVSDSDNTNGTAPHADSRDMIFISDRHRAGG